MVCGLQKLTGNHQHLLKMFLNYVQVWTDSILVWLSTKNTLSQRKRGVMHQQFLGFISERKNMTIRNTNQENVAVKNTHKCLWRCYNILCFALPSILKMKKMGKYSCFHFNQQEYNNTNASAMLVTPKLWMMPGAPNPKLAFSPVS